MQDLRAKLSKAEIYPFNGSPKTNQHIEDEVVKAVQSWLVEKYKSIIEGCDNPCCPFCKDVKAAKPAVDHIFEGFLLQYTVPLPQTNGNNTITEEKK